MDRNKLMKQKRKTTHDKLILESNAQDRTWIKYEIEANERRIQELRDKERVDWMLARFAQGIIEKKIVLDSKDEAVIYQ